jgi:bacillithiol system protein YtxJ
MNWHTLQNLQQLQSIWEESFVHPVAIFKHSTRCSISSTAKDRMERQWNFSDEELPVYYLDLIEYRDISNKVADLSSVQHESPQLIIINKGKAVYHNSHSGIMPRLLSIQDFN